MDNKKWLGLLAITSVSSYFLGYHMNQGASPITTTSQATLQHEAASNSPPTTPTAALATGATPQSQPKNSQSSQPQKISASPVAQVMPNAKPTSDMPQQIPVQTMPPENRANEISDEDIDKLIPTPFNQLAKTKHGVMRERYKDFAATQQPSDRDANLANKMTDFILSSPYAKSIHLESLMCKAELCEVRLFEFKSGIWQVMFAEMSLQDWWSMPSHYESSNFPTQFNNQNVTGTYVLLQRMPPFTPPTQTQ